MEHYELGMALAMAQLAELHRQAERWRLASRIPSRAGGRRRDRAPGSPRLAGRPGQAADRTGGRRPAGAAAASGPGPAATEAAMLIQHPPGVFDPGHCRACARRAGLLDHYDRVQREEARLRQTRMWAYMARRSALWALCSSGGGILLAAVAFLTR